MTFHLLPFVKCLEKSISCHDNTTDYCHTRKPSCPMACHHTSAPPLIQTLKFFRSHGHTSSKQHIPQGLHAASHRPHPRLADGAFQKFSLAYTRRVLDQLIRSHEGQTIPRIVFTKGGGLWLEEMNTLDCEVLGLNWTVNLAKARQVLGGLAGQRAKHSKVI